MGREVKRVPLDFDWPIGKIWDGFLMPKHLIPKQCDDCDQTGYNPETKDIRDDYYDFAGTGRRWVNDITQDEVDALVDAGRLCDFTHKWEKGVGWQKDPEKPHPTADAVNEWSRNGIGHDSINACILVKRRATRMGVFGLCPTCGGEGYLFANEQHKNDYEEWQAPGLPSGDGYQLWETTSEGSPKTPVFADPVDLAKWCVENEVTSFGSKTETYDVWMRFICGPGWAPSAIMIDGKMQSGVAAT